MKKLTTIFLLLFITASLFSQPGKGSFLFNISGTGEYNTKDDYNSEGYKSFDMKIYPKAGYLLNKYLCLGITTAFGYGHEKKKLEVVDQSGMSTNEKFLFKTNVYAFELGPFARFYLPIKKFAPFFHAGYNYIYANEITKTDYKDNTFKMYVHGGEVQLGIGLTYFIAKNIGLEILPLYEWSFTSEKNSSFLIHSPVFPRTSKKEQYNKLLLSLGLQFFLNKKVKD